jgi:hypothetical protein
LKKGWHTVIYLSTARDIVRYMDPKIWYTGLYVFSQPEIWSGIWILKYCTQGDISRDIVGYVDPEILHKLIYLSTARDIDMGPEILHKMLSIVGMCSIARMVSIFSMCSKVSVVSTTDINMSYS